METAAKVALLSSPAFHSAPVRVVETHMSWVFLTPSSAYKLKKPVHYAYLDFRDLESRRHFCHEEVRLNRRLADSVYLGVVALTLDTHGVAALDGAGEVIEWLVHMRRLPADQMLDVLIAHGRVPADGAQRLGRRLAKFYREQAPVPLSTDDYVQQLLRDIEENRRELTDPMFALSVPGIDRLAGAQAEFALDHQWLFNTRIAQGRLVEGHGDLRPEHVCLDGTPVVIDCLEFKREFRLLDAADELAYLALECERLGDSNFGERVRAVYEELNGDPIPEALWHFFKGFRAMLRAKIAVWHNRDGDIVEPQRWIDRANRYLELASAHMRDHVARK